MPVSNEQRSAHIKALLQERAGYEKRGNTNGVAEVNEELRKIGATGEIQVAAAEKRPAAKRGKEKR